MSTPPPDPTPTTAGTRESSSGIAALVLGILGLVAIPLIGSVLALVFGYQSRREAQQRPDVYRDDLGRIGRILGWIGVALSGLGIAAALVVLAFLIAA